MTRLNLLLLAILIACALSVVTSQHKARKLFIELQKSQKAAGQLDVEWGRLQLEQSTWAMHSRIESSASRQLQMVVPDASRIQVMPGATVSAVRPSVPAQPTAAKAVEAKPDIPAQPVVAPEPRAAAPAAEPQ